MSISTSTPPATYAKVDHGIPLFRLVRELGKFFLAVYPMFRQAVAA